MNATQLEAFARQILPIVGTLLTVFGIKSATANAIIDMLMTVIGPVTIIGSAIWSLVSNMKANVISKAAALPEVKNIQLTSTAPAALVDATPNNVNK